MKKIVVFLGPPTAGKSTAAEKVYRNFKNKNKTVLLWDYPKNKRQYLHITDKIKAAFVVYGLLLLTIIISPFPLLVEWKRCKVWLGRVHNEWCNCAIERRYINSFSYEYCVDDGLLKNKLYLEFADPRNILGKKIWWYAIFSERLLPPISGNMTIFVVMGDPEALFLRSLKRSHNIVRSGLSDEEKKRFYIQSIGLYSFIFKSLEPTFNIKMFNDYQDLTNQTYFNV